MTISDIKKQIADGSSVRQVVEAAIERAKADTKHAMLEIIENRALERADEIDQRIQNGEDCGRLAGVPFVVKDNILTFDSKTTASSRMLENFEAPYQATVIDKLEAEGAVCIGKTNLDAFANGSSTENSYFGPTKNSVDSNRVAGGTSGGSAVAVATGIVPFALGTDTGGSVRQPASFNGVVGFRPTYGTVSRYGVIAFASSTDVVGPIANNIEDVRTVYECIQGVDELDSTTIPTLEHKDLSKTIKIGVINEYLNESIDKDVRKVLDNAVKKYQQAGLDIKYVNMPILEYSLPVYYIVVLAELASNLARYDGMKYGIQGIGDDLVSAYQSSRSAGFADENKRRILLGNFVLSSGYYDAYYHKAEQVRTLIIQAYREVFKNVDVVVGPVSPIPAFRLGEKTDDPVQMYLADIMSVPPSLAGLASISIPAGATDAGLPVGLQVTAPMRHDDFVLDIAKVLEDINAK